MKEASALFNRELLLSDSVSQVRDFFQSIEFNKQPIPAQEQFEIRLKELGNGRQVPVVIFNCLDFGWKQNSNKYPESIISSKTDASICKFFSSNIIMLMKKLQTLGKPQLNIIIPDSELFDTRPFSFNQDASMRSEIASTVYQKLSTELSSVDNIFSDSVSLWSEYCKRNKLLSPYEYTSLNIDRIKTNEQLMKKVKKQVKDSERYFATRGLDSKSIAIIGNEITERTLAYVAMYAGEGQALSASKAIVFNFEDGRVTAWFQRGANDELPILTPVNPNNFYNWRKSIKPV